MMTFKSPLKTLFYVYIFIFMSGFYGCFDDQVDIDRSSTGNWFLETRENDDLTHLIDTRSGSGGLLWASGSTAPVAMTPFGMVRLGPDTATMGFMARTSGYYYGDIEILGFSHTRYLGTGLREGGILRTLPSNIEPDVLRMKHFVLPMKHRNEIAVPGYYNYYNDKRGIDVELTSAPRVGVHRYKFNQTNTPHLLIDLTSHLSDIRFTDRKKISEGVQNMDVEVIPQENRILGSIKLFDSASKRYKGLEIFFAIQLNATFEHQFIDGYGNKIKDATIKKEKGKLYLDLKVNSNNPTMAVGFSYTDLQSAIRNLNVEYASKPNASFELIANEARRAWNEKLSRIQLSDKTSNNGKLFYNNLYRTMTMPTLYSDVPQQQEDLQRFDLALGERSSRFDVPNTSNIAFRGYDNSVHINSHHYYSDLSLWDTFRTTHPLYNLIAKDEHMDFIRSMLRMGEYSGRFPRWSGAGYHVDSMLGMPGSIVIAEAILKGLPVSDAEARFAFEIMKSQSSGVNHPVNYINPDNEGWNDDSDDPEGVECLKDIRTYGFCPDKTKGSVSYNLEYSYADYSHYLLAKHLGEDKVAEVFLQRSQNYRNNWNPSQLAFVPRHANGAFETDFKLNELSYTGFSEGRHGYFEGSPNQWRWYVPHDPEGLISLFGRDQFLHQLTEFFERADPGLGAATPGGFYWHGNEPDIHSSYMFSFVGRPDLTQKWVRWALKNKYDLGAQALDGEDDAGTLSAWYVLSAMGIYPIAGTTRYMLGSPLHSEVVMNVGDGKTLTIKAPNTSDVFKYVRSVKINGDVIPEPWFDHEKIADGGIIEFEMSDQPVPWKEY